jgi:hypothetical protein
MERRDRERVKGKGTGIREDWRGGRRNRGDLRGKEGGRERERDFNEEREEWEINRRERDFLRQIGVVFCVKGS